MGERGVGGRRDWEEGRQGNFGQNVLYERIIIKKSEEKRS